MASVQAIPTVEPQRCGGLLVVIAHPDDEIFVSGVLCLCAEAGLRTRLIAVTDGEGGGRELMAVESRERLAEIRRGELARSAAALGATDPIYLHQPDVADPEDAADRTWDQRRVISEIARVIRQMRPEAIVTHGRLGGYGHPAHRLTHRCVMQAVAETKFPGAVFSLAAKVPGAFFSWHFDEASDVRVDARDFSHARAASLASHASQTDYFLQPYFPRTLRKRLSALFGFVFAFTEAGRKRIPVGTPERFFAHYPVEGLALQKAAEDGRSHFFLDHFADDHRVEIDR